MALNPETQSLLGNYCQTGFQVIELLDQLVDPISEAFPSRKAFEDPANKRSVCSFMVLGLTPEQQYLYQKEVKLCSPTEKTARTKVRTRVNYLVNKLRDYIYGDASKLEMPESPEKTSAENASASPENASPEKATTESSPAKKAKVYILKYTFILSKLTYYF
jgi:hypothetical protein